jgi:ornithine cyclodeaminase
MRFIDAKEVHAACEWPSLVAALAEAHRGPMPLVGRAELHHGQHPRMTYLNLPAWQPGIAMGSKLVTVFPENPGAHNLPAIQASYVLIDGRNGTPLAILDGTALTYRKTAADSALGAKLLAAPEPRLLLMVGAGGIAPYLIAAHRAIHPTISRVLVWNRDLTKAARLGEPAPDLESAVRMADIVCCATASTEPLVRGEWLKEGAHLDLVGSFTPEMRECDDGAVIRARIFVDSRWFAIDQPGDLAGPIARGVIAREKIEASLFELCAGGNRLVRGPRDITLFKNGGGGHLDLFTALHVWKTVS